MKVAIVDVLGLAYDGSTLEKRGLGGSESAVISIARELNNLGIDVTVFNDCTTDDAIQGNYGGVQYKPLESAEHAEGFDIVIGSRSLAVFAPNEIRQQFKTFIGRMPNFDRLIAGAKLKILYLHDTFIDGEQMLEDFLLEGRINEVFTLSDFHTDYITNSDHGKKRIFEVMKPYIWQTRNGINKWLDWVDVSKKDPNLFVFNSSLTKGMIPLVEQIWPRVKQQLPDARLVVIGGFYRFREGVGPDSQEQRWRELSQKYGDQITFTGVIPQKEIAELMAQASYMIYPCDFPETFGISALEAIYYNTPLITCRFGALEETAFDMACYKIPYSVVPNWSVPWLNQDRQVDIFCGAVINAYNNKYLHQQKMYACNQVKDIVGWDSVALQWKQHFTRKLGLFLNVKEYREVSRINHEVARVFGRRFINEEQLVEPRADYHQRLITIISPVFNAEKFIEQHILSVAAQDYYNYRHIIIDDASTDDTNEVITKTLKQLDKNTQDKVILIRNTENVGAVKNIVDNIILYCDNNYDIVMLLDGDDWLVNDPNIFHKYNNIYYRGAQFTYGSCWSLADNIPLIAQPYPPEVKAAKSYRNYRFNWNMPYTHLRTFSADLLWKNYDPKDYQDDEGNWLRAGGDTSIFYKCIEAADPDKVVCVPDIVMNYNDINPINDYKVNGEEQTRTANRVLSQYKASDKFSVIVPTMWRCNEIFFKTLEALCSCDLVGEIIVIDNDPWRTPEIKPWSILADTKVKILTQAENIGVNPALNLGVATAEYDKLCLINDDVWFDTTVFSKLKDRLQPNAGIYGIIYGDPALGQAANTDYSIDFVQWMPGDCLHPFGQMMFIHRADWLMLPYEMKISFGDTMQMHWQQYKGRPITMIYNIRSAVLKSATVKDLTIPLNTGETFLRDQEIYNEWAKQYPVKNDDKPYISMQERANIKWSMRPITIPEGIKNVTVETWGGGGSGLKVDLVAQPDGSYTAIKIPSEIIEAHLADIAGTYGGGGGAAPESFPNTPGISGVSSETVKVTTIPFVKPPVKKILIGIPTARYIEVETFKAIYDLEVPEGYETDFQYFYGYNVDQVRNLIASWVINQYDYLFAVDHDITFPPDTLKKLLSHDKSVVTGIYRQRKEEQILEIYDKANLRTVAYEDLHDKGLVEIGACGFGCVLVKKEAFVDVGYPQFVYHDALDHQNTFSEDLDFLVKARQKGHSVWVDTSIVCGHIGSRSFNVELKAPKAPIIIEEKAADTGFFPLTPAEQALEEISNQVHVPQEHIDYLNALDIKPRVIYDIGANVLDWTRAALKKWPNADVYAFEAMDEVKKIYDRSGLNYQLGVLSDEDAKTVKFYQNPLLPWGSSYYKENSELSTYEYTEDQAVEKTTRSLDSVVQERGWPLPDLVKIDVQGAELDILKGARETLLKCTDLIIELQQDEYNLGAPLKDEVIQYLASIGFHLQKPIHMKEHDGDYHFTRLQYAGLPRSRRKIDKAYVICDRYDDHSYELATRAVESSRAFGIKTEFFQGLYNKSLDFISSLYGIKCNFGPDTNERAINATMSHILLWKQIAQRDETAVILEHDAVMLHMPLAIPDGQIVALGYKIAEDLYEYDHVNAGAPSLVINRKRHSGAHAYAITANTARELLKELDEIGLERAIDNFYFMRVNEPGDKESRVPLGLMVPTPAIGLVGKTSSIWDFAPSTLNYDCVPSFTDNLKTRRRPE